MNRTAVMTLAWAGATIVSILVASAAVGAVRGRVADEPHAIAAVTTSLAAAGTAETVPSPSTVPPQTSTSAPGTASTATTLPSPTTVTTTSTPPATTATTAPPSAGQIKTFATGGGTVSIEVFSDHIVLLGAVPSAGYTVAERDLSPRRIEIEFKSGDDEVEFKAVLEDDGLAVDLGSDGDDGEEDGGDH